MTPLRHGLNFERFRFSDTLHPSLNFGDPVSPSHPSLLIHFAGEHTGVFMFVHSLSLDFKGTTTRGSVDATTATSDGDGGHGGDERTRR